jgi:hypothetical protein
MPTATNEEVEPRNANGRDASRDIQQQEQAFADARRASEDAIEAVVGVWAEALNSFVPPVFVRPVDAVDIVFEAMQQVLSVQRRLISELLETSREIVDRSDPARAGDSIRSRASRRQVRAAA